ncbi:MAG TPA: S-adenosylmethionine decarboxylase [Streptosporangiaceae bacterium]|nr:S-adenosylmethionine decarboxylase [Streptosporangiaceae bacterium]
MSGTQPASECAAEYAALRQAEAISPKLLYAIDARSYESGSPVHDLAGLTAIARAAVDAGAGHVLDTSHVVFPNGAITLVLILAESHLSIHTWPEENLVAIDLFSCGAIDGDVVIARLIEGLRLESVKVSRLPRGIT